MKLNLETSPEKALHKLHAALCAQLHRTCVSSTYLCDKELCSVVESQLIQRGSSGRRRILALALRGR